MTMGRLRPRLIAIPLAAVAAAEAGHLLSYSIRFGPGALAAQSAGSHAYLPGLLAMVGGAGGTAVLLALGLIGLARCTSGRRLVRRPGVYLNLASGLFVLQLVVFAGQEAGEAIAAGAALPALGDLLFWGAVGQLPVALAAAWLVGWLVAGVEAAAERLTDGSLLDLRPPAVLSLGAPGRPLHPAAPVRSRWGAAGLRGPPFHA